MRKENRGASPSFGTTSVAAEQVDKAGIVTGMEPPLDRSPIALDPAKPSTGLKVICREVDSVANQRLVSGPESSLQIRTTGLLGSGMNQQSHAPPTARRVMTS